MQISRCTWSDNQVTLGDWMFHLISRSGLSGQSLNTYTKNTCKGIWADKQQDQLFNAKDSKSSQSHTCTSWTVKDTVSKLILVTLHIPQCRPSSRLSVCPSPVVSLQSKYIEVVSEPWPFQANVHFWLGLWAVCCNCMIFHEATWRKEAWRLSVSFFSLCCLPDFPACRAINVSLPIFQLLIECSSDVYRILCIRACAFPCNIESCSIKAQLGFWSKWWHFQTSNNLTLTAINFKTLSESWAHNEKTS